MPEKPDSTQPEPKAKPDGSDKSGVYGGHWGNTGQPKEPGTPPPDRPKNIDAPKGGTGTGEPLEPSPND